tara:strand:- start:5 stop:721 length:717 start_codon:yes stop_codon:yes gene_type:complete
MGIRRGSISTPIISDGLIFNMDAANRACYPKTGTIATDTIENTSGTLNGVTFTNVDFGAWDFDGIDDYVICSNFTDIQGNSAFTVDGWFKRSGTWSSGATWGLGGNTTAQGINSWNYNNSNEITIDLWGTSTYSTGQTYSLTEWKHCVWTYNGGGFTTSNIVIYVNGIAYTGGDLSTLRGGSGTPNINSTGLVFSRAGTTVNNYYGKPIIANFKVYNRTLSPTEVLHNYNALKGRFGL